MRRISLCSSEDTDARMPMQNVFLNLTNVFVAVI